MGTSYSAIREEPLDNQRILTVDIEFDPSYTAGRESVSASDVGLGTNQHCVRFVGTSVKDRCARNGLPITLVPCFVLSC